MPSKQRSKGQKQVKSKPEKQSTEGSVAILPEVETPSELDEVDDQEQSQEQEGGLEVGTAEVEDKTATVEAVAPQSADEEPKLKSAAQKKWREKNRGKVQEYQKKWREKNKEKVKEIHTNYRKKNPEKVKQWQKASQARRKARLDAEKAEKAPQETTV